jgi:sucrose-phosphate synthase
VLWKKYSSNGIQGVRAHYAWQSHCKSYLKRILDLKSESNSPLISRDAKDHTGARLLHLDRMLVTDIDDTLLGDDDAMRRLNSLLKAEHDHLLFGVATGRTLDSARAILREHHVPAPDFIISSVGSEIYFGPDLHPDKGWRSHIAVRWQRDQIEKLLTNLDFLELQEEETQKPFKLSYYMDNRNGSLTEVHQLLNEYKLQYNAVYSQNQFLDILPARASKGKAIRYLCYKWNITSENVLVAGDSGNDEDMLRGSMPAVVVANHSEDLQKLRGLKKIYFSKKKYAAGILDGIGHYQFLK